jgi:tRNA 2-thiouridine synthesizing protein A
VTRERRATGATAPRTGSAAPVAGPSESSPAPGDAAAPPKPALTLDALGKKCPIPIIMLADKIREVPIGHTIEVLADDPAAKADLPAWCALKSQEFVSAADLAVGWSFLVRRSY